MRARGSGRDHCRLHAEEDAARLERTRPCGRTRPRDACGGGRECDAAGRDDRCGDNRRDRPVANDLHPVVYAALMGFVLWLIIAVWGFARDGLSDYLLVIVTGFIAIFVAM